MESTFTVILMIKVILVLIFMMYTAYFVATTVSALKESVYKFNKNEYIVASIVASIVFIAGFYEVFSQIINRR